MCRSTDSYGKNQADAGQDNGSSCMLRRSSGGLSVYMNRFLNLRELGHQCHFLDLVMFYGKELNRRLTNLVFLGFSKAGLPHVP